MKIRGSKCVHVLWQDAMGNSNDWQHVDDLDEPCNMLIQSVGWVVRENKHGIILMPHLSDSSVPKKHYQGCGEMTIPKRSIVKMSEISFKKE